MGKSEKQGKQFLTGNSFTLPFPKGIGLLLNPRAKVQVELDRKSEKR